MLNKNYVRDFFIAAISAIIVIFVIIPHETQTRYEQHIGFVDVAILAVGVTFLIWRDQASEKLQTLKH